MKNYFKKFSIMFVMSLILVYGQSINAFADDSYKFGTANLGNTVENSAKIGDQLVAPEVGWKRYDDSNKNIGYFGAVWNTYKGTSNIWSNSTATYSDSINSVCKFNFTGTKIRIISELDSDHTYDVEVKIDGKSAGGPLSERGSKQTGQVLVYENVGLSEGEHYIEITNAINCQFVFDAVDVTGNILPYNKNVRSITLDKSTMNLTEGELGQLTATTTPAVVGVTWKSSDESIATIEVDPTNRKIVKVNALREGTCTITATTTDGSDLSASCTINVTKPDNPTTDTKTGAILIINLTDGETKVFDVSSSEVDKFKSWYNNKSEFENKLTYVFNKTVSSNISVEEDVVHNQITSFEIRKY